MSTLRQSGFTLVELIIVVMLIGVLAALCAPFLMTAKAAANEASAIGSLKALNTAQVAFMNTCGNGLFSSTIDNLINLAYLDRDLALAPKSGFRFTLALGDKGVSGNPDCGGTDTISTYYATGLATGVEMGRRAFATNQGGVIWQDTSGAAPAEPFRRTDTVKPIQ